MKIAVIGATIMDIVSYVDKAPNYGDTTAANDFHIACGGRGANQAVAAKKSGADVMMVSTVGDDIFGATSIENFRKNGIDTRQITEIKNCATSTVMIIVESFGQYRSIFYRGASEFLKPENILQAADDLKQCGLFVIQLEISLETVYAAIKFANENNIPVLLNPSPMDAITKNISIEKISTCKFLVLNETELHHLTGLATDTDENIRMAARKLLAQGFKNIILTLGSNGSIWFSEGVEEIVPTLKVEAVDSTGAGDAFTGCFVKNIAQGKTILDSMKLASKYAALSVTRKGTQDSYLTEEEFEKFFAVLK